MPLTSINDLKATFDGDLMITTNGDLTTTENDGNLAIMQYIRGKLSQLKSGTQAEHFMSSYVGKPNTQKMAIEMATELKSILIEDGVIGGHELTITPFPISKTAINFRVSLVMFNGVNVNKSKEVSVSGLNEISIFMAFNLSDGQLFILS